MTFSLRIGVILLGTGMLFPVVSFAQAYECSEGMQEAITAAVGEANTDLSDGFSVGIRVGQSWSDPKLNGQLLL